jgi:hypothetical protein
VALDEWQRFPRRHHHRHGLLFTTEPYTSCFESMQVGGKADIPMAEFWANGGYSFSVPLAVSIAHTHGRPIVAAEAFTAGPEIGRWTNHPGSLRQVGDRMWAQGINRFVFHRFAHQPWPDLAPGMTMGQYGIHFQRANTWWEAGRAWANGRHVLHHASGTQRVVVVDGLAAPHDLTGTWEVRFQARRGAPEQARFDKLTPWQEHADEGIRHFSGTAVYTQRFDRADAPGDEVWLDLGKVEVIARVRLNGRDLGILWHPPFRGEITDAL